MAGQNDDIERLIAEMNALNAQAESALGADDATGKQVEKRRGSEPEPTKAPTEKEGMSPALLRALVVSGVATGLIYVGFLLLAVLPFFARPGLSDILAIFASSLLVAGFYTLRNRG
jgi:hypothetical protein